MAELLQGRTALVIGGTKGIGLGIAEVLRNRGANVAVTGVTAAEVAEAKEHGFSSYVLDIRNKQQVTDVVATATQDLGGLSILASNAGVYPKARIEELSQEQIEGIFAINVTGTFFAIQAALPYLRQHGAGRIVVTSSITGPVTGFPGWSHYGATKAALVGMIRSVAIEVARQGITVNAVLPGNISTPGLRKLGQEYMDEMARSIPTGVLGEPEDIGETVAFLASDGAKFITGQQIIVDGGQTLPECPQALDSL